MQEHTTTEAAAFSVAGNTGVGEPEPVPKPKPWSAETETFLLKAFREILDVDPAWHEICLIEDFFFGKGFIPLRYSVVEETDIVATYLLVHFAELKHLGSQAQHSYNPALEPGTWRIEHCQSGLVLPGEIWRCHKCTNLTAVAGSEKEEISCAGCGYKLLEDF